MGMACECGVEGGVNFELSETYAVDKKDWHAM